MVFGFFFFPSLTLITLSDVCSINFIEHISLIVFIPLLCSIEPHFTNKKKHLLVLLLAKFRGSELGINEGAIKGRLKVEKETRDYPFWQVHNCGHLFSHLMCFGVK